MKEIPPSRLKISDDRQNFAFCRLSRYIGCNIDTSFALKEKLVIQRPIVLTLNARQTEISVGR